MSEAYVIAPIIGGQASSSNINETFVGNATYDIHMAPYRYSFHHQNHRNRCPITAFTKNNTCVKNDDANKLDRLLTQYCTSNMYKLDKLTLSTVVMRLHMPDNLFIAYEADPHQTNTADINIVYAGSGNPNGSISTPAGLYLDAVATNVEDDYDPYGGGISYQVAPDIINLQGHEEFLAPSGNPMQGPVRASDSAIFPIGDVSTTKYLPKPPFTSYMRYSEAYAHIFDSYSTMPITYGYNYPVSINNCTWQTHKSKTIGQYLHKNFIKVEPTMELPQWNADIYINTGIDIRVEFQYNLIVKAKIV